MTSNGDHPSHPVIRCAGDYQIGGTHYKDMVHQPRALCMSYDLNGFELLVVKYISRWPNKGGIEDVRKASQCVEILAEDHRRLLHLRKHRPLVTLTLTAREYCAGNELPPVESDIIRSICAWNHFRDVTALRHAREKCLELIHQIMSEDG